VTSLAPTLAALALVAAGPVPPPRPPEPLRRSDIPLALVLSGGVSLGAYEAGLAWAIVRFSQGAPGEALAAGHGAPRLVAVTGASAGSINALLSAVQWCSEPAADDDVDHNVFRDVWIPVGIDGLLPEDAAGYERGDSLLSTRPLLEALDRFEGRLAAAGKGRRLRPGCRLPVGLTVTRARAAEHDVAGLTVRTQRFALPWRLEVGADGAARVMTQPLGGGEPRPDLLDAAHAGPDDGDGAALPWPQVAQGLLASAAFPVAFRPRELCDCSPRCPEARRVRTGSCEGPRGRLTGLACPARSPDGEPLSLCAHPYVDGGIFDNTPVGLGVELTQAVFEPQPLQPVTYVYIDPDLRRLRPAAPDAVPPPGHAASGPAGQNLESAARLFGELVATSRTQDLSRTLRSGVWATTTRSLLYDTAAALVSFSEAERRVSEAAGVSVAAAVALPRVIPGAAVRDATGRALLACELDRPGDVEALARCARAVDRAASGVALASARPLGDDEVVAVAEEMGRGARAYRDAPVTRDPAVLADELRVGALAMLFLADETSRVAWSAIPEARLRQFRAGLLDTVQLGRALAVNGARRANAQVLQRLARLEGDPTLGPVAARAGAAIRAAPDSLFLPGDLKPVLDALEAAGEGAADAARTLRKLADAGPALQAEVVRLNRLARAADALLQSRTERALFLSSRFAPITGSQLGNFGAFLDRPFREYDYDAGIYDAAHTIAVTLCELTPVPDAPSPIRAAGSPSELDLGAVETQRCVGAGLGTALRALGVDRSGTAGLVFRRLARAELDATVGDAASQALQADPAWSWLAAPLPAPDPSVAVVADVLLSARVPCGPAAAVRCLRELSFEELHEALAARGYRAGGASMQALLDDPDLWARRTSQKLLDRSLERERTTPGQPELAPAVLLGHGALEMWLRRGTGVGPFPRLELDPSTIPARSLAPSLAGRRLVAHLVPYRIDLDVARGGVAVSWLDPAVWLGRRLSVVAQLTPFAYQPHGDRLSSTAALLPTVHLAGLSLGAGPRASVRWSDGSTAEGVCLRASVLQERLSLEVGTAALPARGSDVYVTLGVSDLNGSFFWLLGGR
jgi:predicted acylesterase/phospholipase RssA